jgi:hypothetical protein
MAQSRTRRWLIALDEFGNSCLDFGESCLMGVFILALMLGAALAGIYYLVQFIKWAWYQ